MRSTTDSVSEPEETPKHPIGVVCRRTGLKPDLIRAWERRYGAVSPGRSETRRRLYSDADVERLKLLREAVGGGRGIRHVATLPKEDLLELIAADRADEAAPAPQGAVTAAGGDGVVERALAACLEAVRRLDGGTLELELERASLALSRVDVMERLIVPLMHRVGSLWKEGTLRPVHEHLASVGVRSFLGRLPARPAAPSAPHVVVTTPAGQHHELGALLAAECAAEEGWRVTYLGPDLPAEEIAAGCQQKGARAVALSLTHPPDDPRLVRELRRLRRLLAPGVEILAGGRSAAAYAEVLGEVSAHHLETLAALRVTLEKLRSR